MLIALALLFWPGFDDLLLFLAGLGAAAYFWPQAWARVGAYRELSRFKKSIPDGMEDDE